MTSPEVALTGSDRVRMHNRFPRFFLTIVVHFDMGNMDEK